VGGLVAGELVEEVGLDRMEFPAAAAVSVAQVPALALAPLVVVHLDPAAAAAVDEDRLEVDVGARMSSYQDLH
jgi:hypothetical protein